MVCMSIYWFKLSSCGHAISETNWRNPDYMGVCIAHRELFYQSSQCHTVLSLRICTSPQLCTSPYQKLFECLETQQKKYPAPLRVFNRHESPQVFCRIWPLLYARQCRRNFQSRVVSYSIVVRLKLYWLRTRSGVTRNPSSSLVKGGK